jgi:hypothetical protein
VPWSAGDSGEQRTVRARPGVHLGSSISSCHNAGESALTNGDGPVRSLRHSRRRGSQYAARGVVHRRVLGPCPKRVRLPPSVWPAPAHRRPTEVAVPDPDPRVPARAPDPGVPDDPEVPRSGAPGSPDPLPTLERDREVLAWLQCSTQLSGEVTGYLCDALLDWALSGGGYPQMALPEAGAECDHLLTLQQILERFPRWIARPRRSRTSWSLVMSAGCWPGRTGRPGTRRESRMRLTASCSWRCRGWLRRRCVPVGGRVVGVTGWHRNIDDLAAAVADLLTDSSVRPAR